MNPNSVSIYQSLAQISDNNDFLKNHASKDINNQSLKSVVERQPLFQLLSLNQRANSLIKNKTSFLTNSAKCFSQPNDLAPPQSIPAVTSPTVIYSSNNTNSNNIPAGFGNPQPNALPYDDNSQFHQQPAKSQHHNRKQQHYLNDGKQKYNYQHPLRHYSSSGNFRTCSNLESISPFDAYAPPSKVDLNIQTSPIDFSNSIWCPTHNNNSSLSVNSVPMKGINNNINNNNNNNYNNNNYSSLPTFTRTEIDDSWNTSKSNNNSISTSNTSNYFDSSLNDANSLSIGSSRYGNGHNSSISSSSSTSTSFQDSIFDQGIQGTSASFCSPVNTSFDFAHPVPAPTSVSFFEMGNDFTNYPTFDKNTGSSCQGKSSVNASPTVLSAHDHQKIISPANLKLPVNARLFVIKSSNLHDIQQAYYSGAWSSTDLGNRRLHSAYLTNCPIYLLFSVNGSKQFCGIAQMCSGINYMNTTNESSKKETWQESSNKYSAFFRIQFLFVKDLSFQYFKDLTLANNCNKSVANSRDTQEVPISVAATIVEIFTNTPSNSCLLV